MSLLQSVPHSGKHITPLPHPSHPPACLRHGKTLQSGVKETSHRFPNETQEHSASYTRISFLSHKPSEGQNIRLVHLICLAYFAPDSCFLKTQQCNRPDKSLFFSNYSEVILFLIFRNTEEDLRSVRWQAMSEGWLQGLKGVTKKSDVEQKR